MAPVRSLINVVTRTVQEFLDDQPFDLAGALSYYTLLSMAPLLLVVMATAGLFLDGEAVRAQIVDQISGLVGRSSAEFVESIIIRADQPYRGAVAMVTGLAVTILGATTVFAQLQAALNRIWHVQAAPGRSAIWSYLRQRLLSLGMVLTIAFLLLTSLAISALLAALQGYVERFLPGDWIIWRILNVMISLGLVTLLIAMMFKFLPDAKIDWRDTWFGAFITALLFTVGKFLIGMYLGQASIGSTYGAAGSAVVLMVWIYYASLILFFGAKITQVVARQRGARIEPSAHAEPAA
ncbi:MAG: YihY/virulence factor BrkB family protein [Pseudomonadota bacterium]|nr:YihY/virulence factor BrkB family protein [Pseudomonadota bacterium]